MEFKPGKPEDTHAIPPLISQLSASHSHVQTLPPIIPLATPTTRLRHPAKLVLPVGSILLCLFSSWVVVLNNTRQERFTAQETVQGTMPTREEAVKWTVRDLKTKYYSFDIVSTNLTETTETHTYSGQKRGGAAEDAMDRRMFGAAYNAWARGDSFSRMETNWTCDLVITHTKRKYGSNVSTLVRAECSAAQSSDTPPGLLLLDATSQLNAKYAQYEIGQKDCYKVNRIVGGRLMKPVNTGGGIAYVWDTEEREKFYVEPTWVLIVEASKLKPKTQ
jgi:hypothetical protein